MHERIAILIVEDDRDISRFIFSSLNAAGYTPHAVHTLAQARQDFAGLRPAMIILDLGLPDGDGKDWLAEIRKHSDTPVLVLSARQNEQEKVATLDCGADDYLAKPFGVE
ncbi:MAG: response regulator, partial [Pseudomonadota bacterium]